MKLMFSSASRISRNEQLLGAAGPGTALCTPAPQGDISMGSSTGWEIVAPTRPHSESVMLEVAGLAQWSSTDKAVPRTHGVALRNEG